MRSKLNKMIIAASIVVIASIAGILSIYFLGKDNPVEEACEEIIKDETGQEVDLSPEVKIPSTDSTGNKAAS